jgi:hypothetical protein
MMIHVMRDGQQFGPYNLEDLNAYLAQGTLLPTDQAWWEGAPAWVPMDQVPGVQLPGMPAAVPLAAGIEADLMAAANPDVAAAAAAALASKAKKKKIGIIVGATVGVAVVVGVVLYLKNDGGDGSGKIYAGLVEPIFKAHNCYDCHDGSAGKPKGDFDLTKADTVKALVADGTLLERLTDADDPMPPENKGEMLNAQEMDKVKEWIAAGGEF